MNAAAWAAALLDPALPCPPGLRTWNGSDPARRLAVYRNNVISSLVDTLADTFPVTQQLVGDAFFRAMAAVFVRRSPPRSRVLAHYGAQLPAFVAGFEPAAGLPYLPDVARLEFARLTACHAADALPITAEALAAALARPEALRSRPLVWHPSLGVVRSAYAVVSLWAAHQADTAPEPVAIDAPEQALVLRHGLDVLVLPVDAATATWVEATRQGVGLGEAADAALAVDPAFDLAAALGLLLRHDTLVALLAPSSAFPDAR